MGHVNQRYQHRSGEWGAPEEQNSKIDGIDERTDPNAYRIFRDELTVFATDLAKLVVRDREGTTKFAEVSVENAALYAGVHYVASAISTSTLVKTALYGNDAKCSYPSTSYLPHASLDAVAQVTSSQAQ